MNGKIERCINEGLAFSGLIVLSPQLLFTHRPDLWSSPLNAASDFVWPEVENYVASRLRVKLYHAEIAGGELVPVASRSDDDLARRIAQLTGLSVVGVREYRARPRAAEAHERPAAQEDGPPKHFCAARTSWFEERGMIDPKLPKKPAPIPFSEFDGRGQR